MEVKTIGIASDHAGYALKQFVKKYLDEKGYEYKDYGTYTEDSCDYSDFGHALARGIEDGEVYPGIAICGSGEGINMTLNKHQSIRAGLCWIPEIAHLIRQHNDANVLVMPGRFIDEEITVRKRWQWKMICSRRPTKWKPHSAKRCPAGRCPRLLPVRCSRKLPIS